MTVPPYVYANTQVIDVHDGDTLKASFDLGPSHTRRTAPPLDLGLHVYIEAGRIRLHSLVRVNGCNAAELTAPGGPEARDALAALLVGQTLTITTHLDPLDKYGRVLGDCVLPDGTDVSAWLCSNQWAAAWNGAGPRPVPPWPRTVA